MDWTNEQIQAVWEKGITVSGYDPAVHRQDFKGNWIQRDRYGVDRSIQYQWEIHHIDRQADDGSDNIDNLLPLNGNTNAQLQ